MVLTIWLFKIGEDWERLPKRNLNSRRIEYIYCTDSVLERDSEVVRRKTDELTRMWIERNRGNNRAQGQPGGEDQNERREPRQPINNRQD